jgi:hypothetical protein
MFFSMQLNTILTTPLDRTRVTAGREKTEEKKQQQNVAKEFTRLHL